MATCTFAKGCFSNCNECYKLQWKAKIKECNRVLNINKFPTFL